jgi:glycosyltransferase involved in cell wall biosynthesis
MARALNLGMRAATGDVFSWLCDDDFLLPGALNIINENIGDSMWCHAQMLYHNSPYGSFNLWSMLNVGNSMPILSVYWTRRAYEAVGEFDESLIADCDYEYWLRLSMRWLPKPIEKITAFYRRHPGMATHTLGKQMTAEADIIKERYGKLK